MSSGPIFEAVEVLSRVSPVVKAILALMPPDKTLSTEVLRRIDTYWIFVASDEKFKIDHYVSMAALAVTRLIKGKSVAKLRCVVLGIQVTNIAQAAEADETAHFSSAGFSSLSALGASPLAAAVFAASLSFSSLISENLRMFSKKSGPLSRVMSSFAFLLLSVLDPAP